jgi:chemotaxis protein MotA
MDKLSISGLLIAILAIYLGFIIDGGSISSLLELPAFIIVFGGTLGAVMLQSSQIQFLHAISLLKWLFVPPKYDVEQGIESIVEWSEKARESGFLSLEYIAEEENDFFVNKGLNLLVDGAEVENLRVSLELDLDLYREHNLADPELLGQGIATAFVATIYGVGFANLIYLPIANKIKAIVHQQTMYREMMTEGIIAIALAENPHAIENKLSAFRLEQ